MKPNKQCLIVLLCLSIITIHVKAQDARFTQVLANPIRLNPAIMGANTDLKFGAIYRNQWAILGKGYESMAFSGMLPIFIGEGKGKMDIGLSLLNNKAGAFNNLDGVLALAYSLQIASYNNITLSLTGGYAQNNLNTGNLSYDSQYIHGNFNESNPTLENTLIQKNNYADVGFGLLWFMNHNRFDSKLNAYLGASGTHLNEPNNSYTSSLHSTLPAKYSIQGGIKILGNNGIDICPNGRVTMQSGSIESAFGLNIDGAVSDNFKFVMGAWYRKNDAIAILLGIEHKSFAIGYSYDLPMTTMKSYFPGINTNEISLSFKFSRLMKNKMESFGGEGATPSVKNNLFNSF